jgi:hypothetical protein
MHFCNMIILLFVYCDILPGCKVGQNCTLPGTKTQARWHWGLGSVCFPTLLRVANMKHVSYHFYWGKDTERSFRWAVRSLVLYFLAINWNINIYNHFWCFFCILSETGHVYRILMEFIRFDEGGSLARSFHLSFRVSLGWGRRASLMFIEHKGRLQHMFRWWLYSPENMDFYWILYVFVSFQNWYFLSFQMLRIHWLVYLCPHFVCMLWHTLDTNQIT